MMFSLKEQKGIIVFLLMILIVLISKYYSNTNNNPVIIEKDSMENIKLVNINEYLLLDKKDSKSKKDTFLGTKTGFRSTHKAPKTHFKSSHKKTIVKFDFNPNHISYDSLILLGINEKAAHNWTKYLSKGGKFKTKKDIRKIYGLNDKEFSRIKTLILLPDSIKHSAKSVYAKRKRNPSVKSSFISQKIELNSCSAQDLMKLHGIGKVLSKRIIKFRNKLGGFYSVSQLKEVYGLPEETYENIKTYVEVNKSKIKKIRINLAEKTSLSGFPYFNYRLATQIYNYRRQHGYFAGIEDIKKIKTLDSSSIKRIEPYLDFTLK